MTAKESTPEVRLESLERRNFWLWSLSAFLLIALAGTVLFLYVPGLLGFDTGGLQAHARGPIATGLAGLTLLFCLYVFLKQLELKKLRHDLFDARVQEDSLRARVFELTSLFDAAGQVQQEQELEPLLESITRRVLTCLEADRASILLIDPETRDLRCRAVSGAEAQFVRDCRIPLGQGIAGWVAENNEPLVLNDDDMVRRFAAEVKPGSKIHTAMCLPLAARGQVLGVLNVSRIGREHPFTASDARLVTTFADHVAYAIRRIEDYAELERRMTGLAQTSWDHAQRNRVKEIFLEAANEEIRGPLTCILAYAEFLGRDDKGLDPEKRTTFARILCDQAARLEDVVTQSGLLLRLDARDVRLERRPCTFNEVVTACLEDMEQAAITGGITLVSRLEPGLPRMNVDAELLGQGVRALLAKAIQVSESGSTVRVTTRRENDFIQGEVTGTRVAIAPQDLVRAFELSGVEDGSHNLKVQGLGLGLHLLKRVVELHGGRVWAESAPKRASSFYFALPLSLASESGTAAPEEPVTEAA